MVILRVAYITAMVVYSYALCSYLVSYLSPYKPYMYVTGIAKPTLYAPLHYKNCSCTTFLLSSVLEVIFLTIMTVPISYPDLKWGLLNSGLYMINLNDTLYQSIYRFNFV